MTAAEGVGRVGVCGVGVSGGTAAAPRSGGRGRGYFSLWAGLVSLLCSFVVNFVWIRRLLDGRFFEMRLSIRSLS